MRPGPGARGETPGFHFGLPGAPRRAGWTAAACVAVVACLAAGAALSAQEPAPGADASPIAVETLEIEPTVVKTGDVITQTYRLRFPDLISEGREILILEDRMAPENLPVHPFEAVALEVRKGRVDDEHIWDFVYDLRLIAPEKAVYIVPSFSFYYLLRDLGEDIEDAEIQQVDGGQSLVRYVSTMTDVPVLDIRDSIELGEFASRATLFRTAAWVIAPLPLLVWALLLIRQARKPEEISTEVAKELEELERLEAMIPAPPSIWEARRTLRRHVRALQDAAVSDNGALRDLTRDLVISTREYLRAELPELRSGDTPKDIQRHVGGLKDGGRKEALAALSSRLVAYHGGLERGDDAAIANPFEEAELLDASLSALRPHVRLWRTVTGVFGRG